MDYNRYAKSYCHDSCRAFTTIIKLYVRFIVFDVLEHKDSKTNKWDDGSTIDKFISTYLDIYNEDESVDVAEEYCGSIYSGKY